MIHPHHLAMSAAQAHMLSQYYQASRPASVTANPTVLAFSIFGLATGSVISIDTLARIWAMLRDDPFPLRHPVTAERLVFGGFFLAVLCYVGPEAVVFMSWPDVAAGTRRTLSLVNRWSKFAGCVPLVASSLLWLHAQPVVSRQLRRQPIPVDATSRWDKFKRPLWIGFLLLLVSVALSFGR